MKDLIRSSKRFIEYYCDHQNAILYSRFLPCNKNVINMASLYLADFIKEYLKYYEKMQNTHCIDSDNMI